MEGAKIKVVVLSSTQFGFDCIQEAILPCSEVELCGVLTTDCEIDISYSDQSVEIKTHANFEKLNLVKQCEIVSLGKKVRKENCIKVLSQWKPDLILVLGWYYMVPKEIREMAPLGCLGIHASLLPKYRGGAPLVWAIIQGEKKTGISLFYLEGSVDSGDIVAQKEFSIEKEDTCATLIEKSTQASINILKEYIPKIVQKKAPRTKQDETQATTFPQRSPEDGLIDWSWSDEKIRNFIRAQTKPYPGAYAVVDGKKVILWSQSDLDRFREKQV